MSNKLYDFELNINDCEFNATVAFDFIEGQESITTGNPDNYQEGFKHEFELIALAINEVDCTHLLNDELSDAIIKQLECDWLNGDNDE